MLKPNLKLKKDLNLSFRFNKMLHISEIINSKQFKDANKTK